jgi:hypothetical protein
VDQWCQADQLNLDWHKRNQKALRAEMYAGVRDAAVVTWIRMLRVVLSSSHAGCDRNMQQLYKVRTNVFLHVIEIRIGECKRLKLQDLHFSLCPGVDVVVCNGSCAQKRKT